MKILYSFTIILLLGCFGTDSVEVLESYPDGAPKTVKVYFDDNDLNNYILKCYFQDGGLEFEGKVVNDMFVEYKKTYFENGQLKEFIKLTDSADLDYCCPDGFYQIFYKTGSLKETHYKKYGLFNGLVTTFDSNGIKAAEYQVFNDLKNGLTKTFYSNGTIASIKDFLNDTLIGTAYFFTETGDTLYSHGTYKGEIDFPLKYWKENGTNLIGEYYNDNYSQVKWTWIDSIGTIIKEEVTDTINGKFVTPDFNN